jgi:diguanylate cyclase (GGDEF)-like protein
MRRGYIISLVGVLMWFTLAPLALDTRAVFAPGHVLVAGTLAVAGVAHLMLLRQARLLGAAVVGVSLLLIAAAHVWIVLFVDTPSSPAVVSALVFMQVLYLITALGMQLMTFEDMTEELTSANSQLKAAQIELRQMVVTDSLTGLHNRRFFEEIIAHELNLHRRYGTPLSLVFLDVDRFKSINDTLGHAAGDNTLRDVASFLTRHVRNADYVFRWGGDEFLILLSCREEEARRKGWELQSEFSRSSTVAALPEGVGLSFGCAEVPALAEAATEALHLADERMYADKRAARLPLLETLENVRTGDG